VYTYKHPFTLLGCIAVGVCAVLPASATAGETAGLDLAPAWLAADEGVDKKGASFTLPKGNAEAELGVLEDDGEVPTLLLAQAESEEPVASREEIAVTDTGSDMDLPVSLSLKYSLYSDYIYRFVNYSEYAGEGREKPNHQLDVDTSLDLGDFGTIGFNTWFEWYAAQDKILASQGGQNLQEVNYIVYWGYSLEDIATDLTIGYKFYHFPNAAPAHSSEWWFLLEHNDSSMWTWLFPNNEEGVLNPSFFLAHDVDALGGVWMELAVNHTFDIFENFTLTPGVMFAIDACYNRDNTTRFAGDQFSMVAEYDLGSLMNLPDWAGSLSITGELYFNNAWGNFEDDQTGQDEFWGGMSVNWAWGG